MEKPTEPTAYPERDIFFAAMEMVSGEERSTFLERACGSDPALRNRVDRLLAHHLQEDSFRCESAANTEAVETTFATCSEKPGTLIGRYKLLEQIGEGGFGVVFLAEQEEPIRRKVAIKVIKAGMDTKQVIARFEAERQALAVMDHPNIAKVLDAGSTDPQSPIPNRKSAIPQGRPYFVMELVRGIPITKYCEGHQLTVRDRLELFILVCQAIQHAHQKGIIHRDINPSV